MDKQTIIIYLAVIILIFLRFYKNKKTATTKEKIIEFEEGIKKLIKHDKLNFYESVQLEQLFRKETAHFKSKQFLTCNSPGMEKFNNNYPYGWTTLHRTTWIKKPFCKPTKFVKFNENGTNKTKYFLKFNTLYCSMLTVLNNARYRKSFSKWYSLNPTDYMRYEKEMNTIIPRITYKIFKK